MSVIYRLLVMADGKYATLRGATMENTPLFQLAGCFVGKVIDAYDGDTCKLAVAIPGSGIRHLVIRMLGYDAPEMKTVSGVDHKPYGREVKAVFAHLVLGKMVLAVIPEIKKPDRPDPYGRVLAYLYVATRGSFIKYDEITSSPSCFLLACCARPRTDGEVIADDNSADVETKSFTIRGAAVTVPSTGHVPEFCEESHVEQLLQVNQWMVDHGRCKPYGGKGKRPGYTADEIKNGI